MLPNFLGLGAARSGSTWIARVLMHHPDVFVPTKKELHFFDRYFENGIDYYKQEFVGHAEEIAVGEVTPQYFHNPAIAPLINEYLPDVKMFVSLRNPVQRAYSHYWRLVAVSEQQPVPSFEDALLNTPEILEVGHYVEHLERFYKLFSPEKMKVMIYDDLEADPTAFMNELFGFLGVSENTAVDLADQRINSAASLQNLGRNKGIWYVYRVLDKLRIYRVSGKLEQINRRELPTMSSETELMLKNHYQPFNKRLESLLGRDLGFWNY